MDREDERRTGYYQAIAKAFLERRGAPLLLSPKDQAVLAGWEARRIPLRVVLEGLARAFEGLKARGRGPKGVSLAACERQVDAAFAQYRERHAGGRTGTAPAAARPGKRDRARREIAQALAGLGPGEAGLAAPLTEALRLLEAATPDEAGLERLEAALEEALWAGTTAADRAEAEAGLRREPGSRRPKDLAGAVRRRAVQAARAARRVPHVSLFYY